MPREDWPPDYIPDGLDNYAKALWEKTDKLIVDICHSCLPASVCKDTLSVVKGLTEDNGHVIYVDYPDENVILLIHKLITVRAKVNFFNVTVIFTKLDNSSVYVSDSEVNIMIDFTQFPAVFEKMKREFEKQTLTTRES